MRGRIKTTAKKPPSKDENSAPLKGRTPALDLGAPQLIGSSSSRGPSAIKVSRDGGQPLTESERSFFEQRFGCDFSRIRVHTGVQAARALVLELGARAFTVGSDLVFGAGQYNMQMMMGRTLLAHELTHAIQQNAGAISYHSSPPHSTPHHRSRLDADGPARRLGEPPSRSSALSEAR